MVLGFFGDGAPSKSNRGLYRSIELPGHGFHSPISRLYLSEIGLWFACSRSCMGHAWILLWIEGSSTPPLQNLLDFIFPLKMFSFLAWNFSCMIFRERYNKLFHQWSIVTCDTCSFLYRLDYCNCYRRWPLMFGMKLQYMRVFSLSWWFISFNFYSVVLIFWNYMPFFLQNSYRPCLQNQNPKEF